MENIKGFKVFNPDWTCKGFQYEVGKIYEEDVKPKVCDIGFHFCKQAKDCFIYYNFDPSNKVAEVIALGDVDEKGNKCSTNKIEIVRQITWQEVLTIVNIGKGCTGYSNSGDYNSGNRNSGDRNSGDYNSGNYNSGDGNSGDHNSGSGNSGDRNSGEYNSGDWNSGNGNIGNRNSGDRNIGSENTGYWNSGNYNTGIWNSGNWNSGRCNIGHWNSGDCNIGDWNKASNVVGCFNTQSRKLRFFDKETNMTFEQWRNSEAYRLINSINFSPVEWIWPREMSDVEKIKHPEYETTSGYLKIRDNTFAYTEWWYGLSQNEKQAIMSIPNFDADKFFKITGIKVGE